MSTVRIWLQLLQYRFQSRLLLAFLKKILTATDNRSISLIITLWQIEIRVEFREYFSKYVKRKIHHTH
jgi:hypothetical protein